MRKKFVVELPAAQRKHLRQLLSSGREKVRKLTRARVLLKADESWTDEAIHGAVDVSISTVARVRRRFVAKGLQGALNRRPASREYERKLDGNAEAHLIALACGAPPQGRERWSLRSHVKVAERRTRVDWDICMRRLVSEFYPDAERVRVVMDNLNTHNPAGLCKVFNPKEARRLPDRLEFHCTPIHGRDGIEHPDPAVSPAAHTGLADTGAGSLSLATNTKHRPLKGELALHH